LRIISKYLHRRPEKSGRYHPVCGSEVGFTTPCPPLLRGNSPLETVKN